MFILRIQRGLKMFNPVKEVTDVAESLRLKDMGFPQDVGGWYWVQVKHLIGYPLWELAYLVGVDKYYAQLFFPSDGQVEVMKKMD